MTRILIISASGQISQEPLTYIYEMQIFDLTLLARNKQNYLNMIQTE